MARLTLTPPPGWRAHDTEFPACKTLHPPEQREVPVYEGSFVAARGITPSQFPRLARVLDARGNMARENFHYRACDDEGCYRPREVQLGWTLPGKLPDRERAPEELRR